MMETTLNETITARVEAALDTIRPYLMTDGGNVTVLEITPENVVKLELVGACSSCSMSAMTFKAGIEDAIRRAVPEVTRIEALNVAGVRS